MTKEVEKHKIVWTRNDIGLYADTGAFGWSRLWEKLVELCEATADACGCQAPAGMINQLNKLYDARERGEELDDFDWAWEVEVEAMEFLDLHTAKELYWHVDAEAGGLVLTPPPEEGSEEAVPCAST